MREKEREIGERYSVGGGREEKEMKREKEREQGGRMRMRQGETGDENETG